jgi:hypothetical protein
MVENRLNPMKLRKPFVARADFLTASVDGAVGTALQTVGVKEEETRETVR